MTWQSMFRGHLLSATTLQASTAQQIVSRVSVFDEWLPSPAKAKSEICEQYGKPAMATTRKIQEYFRHLFNNGKSSDIRHHIKSDLIKYYNWLKKIKAIKEVPEIDVVIRRVDSERGQSAKGISEEDLGLLNKYLQSESDDREQLIISCLSDLGIRAHELLKLSPEDFMRDQGIVSIRSTKTEHTSKYGGQRYMVVPPSLFDMVEEYVENNGIEGLLFTIGYRRLSAIVARIEKRAGIASLKMHGFRHNCVTKFCSQTGADGATPVFLPTEISTMFGMSTKTVMNVYYHPSTKDIVTKVKNSGIHG